MTVPTHSCHWCELISVLCDPADTPQPSTFTLEVVRQAAESGCILFQRRLRHLEISLESHRHQGACQLSLLLEFGTDKNELLGLECEWRCFEVPFETDDPESLLAFRHTHGSLCLVLAMF